MIFDRTYLFGTIFPSLESHWSLSEAARPILPASLPVFSRKEQKKNERWLLQASSRIRSRFLSLPGSGPLYERSLPAEDDPAFLRWKKATLPLLYRLILEAPLSGIRDAFSGETLTQLSDCLEHFYRRAKNFSPSITQDELGQALRNYLVYLVFRVQNNLTPDLSDAIFGYSMLYPFTDNFLDAPEHTCADKRRYNRFIRDCILDACNCSPDGPDALKEPEEKTGMLIRFAASLPVSSRQEPFSCSEEAPTQASLRAGLLLMLEAQEESQRQSDSRLHLSESEIFSISLFKGGLSVLLDRFLTGAPLTQDDIIFYTGFGLLLQLADDLQDIASDKTEGSRTLFSVRSSIQEMDALLCRLYAYTDSLLASCPVSNPEMNTFLHTCCFHLLSASAAGSGEFFSPKLLQRLEESFPVSFAFLKEHRQLLVIGL